MEGKEVPNSMNANNVDEVNEDNVIDGIDDYEVLEDEWMTCLQYGNQSDEYESFDENYHPSDDDLRVENYDDELEVDFADDDVELMEEIKMEERIETILANYGIPETVFGEGDLEELKVRQKLAEHSPQFL